MVSKNHTYGAYFHFNRRSRFKPIRKDANKKIRTYTGDVSDHGWYKRVYDVQYMAY